MYYYIIISQWLYAAITGNALPTNIDFGTIKAVERPLLYRGILPALYHFNINSLSIFGVHGSVNINIIVLNCINTTAQGEISPSDFTQCNQTTTVTWHLTTRQYHCVGLTT